MKYSMMLSAVLVTLALSACGKTGKSVVIVPRQQG